MLYAKSKGEESIKQHTKKLLDNMDIIKNEYGDKIIENKGLDSDRFWSILRLACLYHDIGKVYTPFQNIILKKLNLPTIPTDFNYSNIKHEQLSPAFIPIDKMDFNKSEKKILFQSIYYHHERNGLEVSKELVDEIIKKDILPHLENIKVETGVDICELNSDYLKYVSSVKRITDESELYIEYCLVKGLLHRLDHASSANLKVENIDDENIKIMIEDFMKSKNFKINDLQNFASDNVQNNLLVIGSTGIGKTEAALLWSNNDKTFFTLPIRISINAIYDRIRKIGYKNVGLLHSTARDYLDENEEFENQFETYEQSKNLCLKITPCTIDQIFPFVFKYKGYEKIYATMAYSKIVIDEIQAYSPEIVAIILKGLQMINNIGGKFMIMTATLPRIYKDELKKMGIDFKYNQFLKNEKRHKIKIYDDEIINNCDEIIQKSSKSKVLIIVNTINKAIEVYKKIKNNGGENVNLLHSRFILQDRNLKETEIKEFSSNKKNTGIWITTQIVEASLDIDFDYLYTEMSTLDSLFQRLGRCYRNRSYDKKEENVFVFTKNVSGIKYVYDEDIFNISINLLKKYDGEILNEKDKVDLVDKLYSEETLYETNFYKNFKNGMRVLNNIVDYENSKTDAQKLLRNIENLEVIPKIIYDENLDLFRKYNEEKDWNNKNILKAKINKMTTNISKSQARRLNGYITKNPYIENSFIIDLKYDSEVGLVLEKDNEYDMDEKFC